MSRLTLAGLIVLCIVLLPFVLLFALSGHTQVQFDPQPKAIGPSSPVKLKASNSHGLRRVTAWLEQDGARTQVFESSNPSARFTFWRKREPIQDIAFTPQVTKEGKARLVVEVQSNDLW